MNRKYCFLALLCIGYLLASCASTKSYSVPSCNIKRTTLGVLPFLSENQSFGNHVSDAVGSNLLDSGSRIIERSFLVHILNEHGYSELGLTESINYKEIGKLVKADYLLVGSLDVGVYNPGAAVCAWMGGNPNTPFMSGATAKIVDINTEQVVVSVTVSAGKGSLASLQPAKMGKSLAAGIKREIAKTK